MAFLMSRRLFFWQGVVAKKKVGTEIVRVLGESVGFQILWKPSNASE